jgi:hypothetical protein
VGVTSTIKAIGMASTTTETVRVPSITTEAMEDTTLPNGPWVVIPARQTDPEKDDNSDLERNNGKPRGPSIAPSYPQRIKEP